jgi:hypothetical protein
MMQDLAATAFAQLTRWHTPGTGIRSNDSSARLVILT